MALNYVFIGFFILAFAASIIQFILTGNPEVFSQISLSLFESAETSVSISIYLIGIMTLWLGFMKIGEKGGAIDAMSKAVQPIFKHLFPEIPKGHPAQGSMIMNISANMLGLDNAATPLGLKAMEDLQSINPTKDKASNAMIMFLVLNTSGLTLIPISVIALRAAEGAANPADVFLPILLATTAATLAGLIAVSIVQKINLLKPAILLFFAALAFLIGLSFYAASTLSSEVLNTYTGGFGNFILLLVIVLFLLLGWRKKVNVYDAFIEGAKDGFQVAIGIIPYLVAMLAAISVFRASGLFDVLINGVAYLIGSAGLNTDFVPALPTAFMKPLSGSGARGMMVEAMNNYGVDSFVARLSGTFQGSTETTFYTLAVYYGAVKIKNIRYTLTCGLIADFAGIIAAIFVAYAFFH